MISVVKDTSSSINIIVRSFVRFPMQSILSKTKGVSNHLVVLHGLCGSPSNFQAIVKNPKIRSQVHTHLLDWHTHRFNPQSQSENLLNTIKNEIPGKVCLMGHSMGAKIIMNTLTSYSQELADKVSGTIIIDLLPWYPQTGEADIADKIIFHDRVGVIKRALQKLLEAGLEHIHTPEEVKKVFLDVCANKLVADLLLHRYDIENKKWKLNPQEVIDHFDEFIYGKPSGTWNGKLKIILGENSKSIRQTDIPLFSQVFPSISLEADVKVIPSCGHWVQVDQPTIFINEVSAFLKEVFPTTSS